DDGQADREPPADLGLPRRHGDQVRGRAWAALQDRPADRRGRARPDQVLGDGEALLHRRRHGRDHPGRPDPRRLRVHAGVPGRTHDARREDHADLRGHERDPADRDRARDAAREPRVPARRRRLTDAVVVGSGPNGLAAAITLAQAGLSVEVHEAAERVGGGVRSAELTLPGFTHDVCSAIYPLAVGSPFFRGLDLDVEWLESPSALAHPFDDGTAVTLERAVDATAVQLGPDEDAYRRLVGPLVRAWPAAEQVLLAPLVPPSPRA